MSAVADRPRLFRDTTRHIGGEGAPRHQIPASDGGRLTLEQRLDRVWEGLTAGGGAECPVCRTGAMRRGGGAAACSACGSSLT